MGRILASVLILVLASALLAEGTGCDRYDLEVGQKGQIVASADERFVRYVITLENGGERDLKLYVRDRFPLGAELINTTVKHPVSLQNCTYFDWVVASLKSGDVSVASLWLNVTQCQEEELINTVVATSPEGIVAESVSVIKEPTMPSEQLTQPVRKASQLQPANETGPGLEEMKLKTTSSTTDALNRTAWLQMENRSMSANGPYGRITIENIGIFSPRFGQLLEESGYEGTRDAIEEKSKSNPIDLMLALGNVSYSGAEGGRMLEPRKFYVGSTTTKKYHYPDCKWAKGITPGNRVWFLTPEEAKTNGYTPCGTCNPP